MERFGHQPARDVSIRSMNAVESGNRDAWLALFTDDAVVQDPIGPSPLDPEGKGHRGSAAIAAFYDNVISQGQVRFDVRESYVAGDECANVGTITTTFPDGTAVAVDVVSTYATDGAGRLLALRAYWEFEATRVESVG
jgi:ketosteroid isomerase-like protein